MHLIVGMRIRWDSDQVKSSILLFFFSYCDSEMHGLKELQQKNDYFISAVLGSVPFQKQAFRVVYKRKVSIRLQPQHDIEGILK